MRKLSVLVFVMFLAQLSFGQFKKISGKMAPNGTQLTLKPNRSIQSKSVAPQEPISFQSLNAKDLEERGRIIQPVAFNKEGVPIAFEGELNDAQKMSLDEQANQYLQVLARYYDIPAIHESVKIVDRHTDDLNMAHWTYQLMENHIPIEGYEIKLHGRDGKIIKANGILKNVDIVEDAPKFTQQQIEKMIAKYISRESNYVDLSNEKYALFDMDQISSNLRYKEIDEAIRLVYIVDAYTNLIDRNLYFVDANTGDIIEKRSNYCKFHHAVDHHCNEKKTTIKPPVDGPKTAYAKDLKNINRLIHTYEVNNVFYMMDASRDMFIPSQSDMPHEPVGAIVTLDAFDTYPENNDFKFDYITSSNNVWNNKNAVSAHFNGGEAYEYYKNTFGRNSINGLGGNILSLINISDENGNGFDNAFWNGKAMFYGSGNSLFGPLAKALDVAGHEMTHGVIQTTANLTYQGESGAINESMADVFGVMIDRDDWQLGEDIVTNAFPSGALRDMANPNNGGTQLGDIGWQPKHVNEQYHGSQDNGGVHINSGIPNHAYYLFATSVGKGKAEQVYYRALTTYLLKSSNFVDLRLAVEQASLDLYDSNVKDAASAAFSAVGINAGSTGGGYQNDIPQNPGDEFVIYTGSNNDGVYYNTSDFIQSGLLIGDISVQNKPSITDDGANILFVGSDHKIYNIFIDWELGEASLDVLVDSPDWRNVAVAKDGSRMAALANDLSNEIYVYDFGKGEQQIYSLYNPTFTPGVNTGDVDFADAITFDFSGEFLIYDAQNTIKGTTDEIVYWDIGFIKVFDMPSNQFGDGSIQKLINQLPENTNIGNPIFSKNSPYIMAFDYINVNSNRILGANIETGDISEIYINNTLGYPDYNKNDSQIMFEFDEFFGKSLATINLLDNKIEGIESSAVQVLSDYRFGLYAANGYRSLTDIEQVDQVELTISPNPVYQEIQLQSEITFEDFEIINVEGRIIEAGNILEGGKIVVKDIPIGLHYLKAYNGAKMVIKPFVKL